MEKEEYTVDPQDEQKEEESYEVDESEEEESDESTEEDEENSTQLQDELKKRDAEIAKLNRLLNKKDKTEEKPSEKQSSSNEVTREDLERIRLEAKGYDDDQVNFLMRFGGSDALKDEAIQTVVKTMADKKKQEQAQATSTTQGKSSRRYSQDELRNMPVDKLEKLIREGKIK